MSDWANPLRLLVRSFVVAVLATFVLAAAVACAWSQSPPAATPKSVIIQVTPVPAPGPVVPPEPPAVVQAAPEPSSPPENPGLINELGKLFNNSTSLWPALPAIKMPGDSLDVIPKLNTMVKGRMACPLAANGAPDCKTASDRLCQSKGFKEGKSMDTDAAQSCSAKVMIPGRKQEEGDCKTENYVTRALCQ
jgi:hypothetical protein